MPYTMSGSCQISNLSELYQKYFPDKTDGVFVDVGAFDGYIFSNVWGLAQAGWSGLCIEPMPDLFWKCLETYKNLPVSILNTCIGDMCGNIKLYTSSNPTIDEETATLSPWDSAYDKSEFIMSKCLTLDVALEESYIPNNFQVLSIDVEGAELQVLRGFTWQLWMPKMIIIETHENNPDKRKAFHAAAINEWFSKTPYGKVQIDGLNAIFVLGD